MLFRYRSFGLFLALALLPAPFGARAEEVFVLANGGRVVGELLNPAESPRETWIIKTAGGQITLTKNQVKQVLHQSPEEIEYEKIRPRYPDTPEGQWALAEWCLKRGLRARRNVHLKRILELDADHEDARHALGYSQVDGEWKTQKQAMLDQGYVFYKGRWRLPQQVELMKKKRQREAAEAEWAQKLKMWRGWLGDEKTPLARKNILAIDDPAAVKALGRALADDPRRPAQMLYIETLAKLGTPEAKRTLALCSMEAPDEEIRLSCLDYLKKEPNPEVVAFYVSKLKSKDNREVNLAGVALSHMGDPSAIRPLIDALVTTHKYKIVTGNSGDMSATFSNRGSGLSMGNKPKIVRRQHANQAVLDALVGLTGVNFNYDIVAWRAWHASRQKHTPLDARRGALRGRDESR